MPLCCGYLCCPTLLKVLHASAYFLWIIYLLCYLSIDRRQMQEIARHWVIDIEIACFLTVNRYGRIGKNVRVTSTEAQALWKRFQMTSSISAVHSVGALHGPAGLHKFYSMHPCAEFIWALHLLCTNQWSRESSRNSTSKNKVSQWIQARQLMPKAPR